MTMQTTTKRSFMDEYKREAVSLLASSNWPLTQVAIELGIQPSMLRSWRGKVDGIVPQLAGGGVSADDDRFGRAIRHPPPIDTHRPEVFARKSRSTTN